MFEIGDRIKCIDAEWHNKDSEFDKLLDELFNIGDCPLVKGDIYTVRGWYHSKTRDIPPCVCLEEVQNRANEVLFDEGPDSGFDPRRFRKVLDIKEGMTQVMSLFNRPPSRFLPAAPKRKILEPTE